MQLLHCSGPGPHAPADGVLGKLPDGVPLPQALCAACALLTPPAPPAPPAPDLPAIADQVTQLTDAVNLLILNSLGV